MKKRYQNKRPKVEQPKFLSSLLLIAYGFITVLTPNMRTFDSNGPKFLTFAALNLLVFCVFFFFINTKKDKKLLFGFFNNNIGIAYGIVIVMALLSFTKSININESILHFSKVFTAFTAAWFVAILISYDKNSLKPLVVAMTLLLIVDSVQTYSGVADYINGKLGSVKVIKASYSNANILTSAIFVKLPFAFWLFYFRNNWMKYLGGVGLFLGILATFFMSSRAFYLGLIFITITLVIYSVILYKKKAEKLQLKTTFYYLLLLTFAFGIFSLVQHSFYPKSAQDSTTFTSRLSTITSTENASNNLRLTAWGQSLQMIKKDPVLGVGIGNWKLRVLEYENKYSPSYTYMYKNHNDFLETTAESGLLAGLAFIAIFILILWYFIKSFWVKKREDYHMYLFLPAFGIIAYAFDAFFNFPQDRPEIQSLFAIYVGVAVGIVLLFTGEDSPLVAIKIRGKHVLQKIFIAVVGVSLLGSVYILGINVKSLKLQRIIKEEINSGQLKSPSSKFLEGFPSIPDITILAEPIAVQKARYLLEEKKYEEAREVLRKDQSNPFDARKEYFMAMSFYNQNQYDSAMFYAQKVLEIKPYFYNNNTIMAFIHEKRGEFDKSIALWRAYLVGVKNREQAWTVPVSLLERQNKLKEAESLVDSALLYLPKSKEILNIRARIKQKTEVGPHMALYSEAVKYYTEKNYKKALPLFNDFIQKSPNYAKAYELRAICYYQLQDYQASLNDILKEESLGVQVQSSVINIKGACYLMLGDKINAKKYFKKSMDMGDKDGLNNYTKYFKEEAQEISFAVPTNKK